MTAKKPVKAKPRKPVVRRAPPVSANQGNTVVPRVGPTPMFVRFANSELSEEQLGLSLSNTPDEATRKLAEGFAADPRDLSEFREDFKECLKDFIENGPVRPVTEYLDSYMSVSLDEVTGHEGKGSWGTSSRIAVVKDPGSPWPEAMVCYNLCVYLKGFGNQDLKRCKSCGRFFTHKGPYASYCSDACKATSKG